MMEQSIYCTVVSVVQMFLLLHSMFCALDEISCFTSKCSDCSRQDEVMMTWKGMIIIKYNLCVYVLLTCA